MSKTIYILHGNPVKESLTGELAERYRRAAEDAGHTVKLTHISDMRFNPVLEMGYKKVQELEDDLKRFQEDVRRADHIVLLFPVWWGGMPAVLKGLFDRALLPGFGFSFEKGTFGWKKLLRGKTGRIITTADTPRWYLYLIAGSAARSVRRAIFSFCGIRARVTEITPVKMMDKETIERWKRRIEEMGARGV